MAESYVQLPTDATGKKLRTVDAVIGANTVHHQGILICDSSGNVVDALTSNPAGTERGLVTRNIPSGTQPVSVAGVVTTTQAGTTGAQTSVASTTTPNTTLLAADANRLGATVYNESTSVLWVLLGAGTESTTVYTLQIAAGGYYEVPNAFCELRISGHWTAANGSARITAVT